MSHGTDRATYETFPAKPHEGEGELPPCPLCRRIPLDDSIVMCRTLNCELENKSFLRVTWRRLAAPALAPEAVAVLEACEVELPPEECGDPEVRVGTLWDALATWRAAGRPGLPRKEGA